MFAFLVLCCFHIFTVYCALLYACVTMLTTSFPIHVFLNSFAWYTCAYLRMPLGFILRTHQVSNSSGSVCPNLGAWAEVDPSAEDQTFFVEQADQLQLLSSQFPPNWLAGFLLKLVSIFCTVHSVYIILLRLWVM